jgi:hypothetical protein
MSRFGWIDRLRGIHRGSLEVRILGMICIRVNVYSLRIVNAVHM